LSLGKNGTSFRQRRPASNLQFGGRGRHFSSL